MWKCKNCKVGVDPEAKVERETKPTGVQRESSASITAGATPYGQSEVSKAQNILQFDCRGLEFIEFKPEVSLSWSPPETV